MYRLIISICIFSIASQVVKGQNILHKSDHTHRVIISTGIDPSWNASLCYQRNVGVNLSVLTAYAEWEASVVRPGIRNWDANLGAVIPLFNRNNFHLLTDPSVSMSRIETRNFNSFGVLAGNEIAAGFFKDESYFSFLFAYNQILASYLSPSDFYRTTFFEDAQRSWYSSTGGYFQFGISAGLTFIQKHDIFIELKIPLKEDLGGFGGSPAHINLGYGYRI